MLRLSFALLLLLWEKNLVLGVFFVCSKENLIRVELLSFSFLGFRFNFSILRGNIDFEAIIYTTVFLFLFFRQNFRFFKRNIVLGHNFWPFSSNFFFHLLQNIFGSQRQNLLESRCFCRFFFELSSITFVIFFFERTKS